MEILRKQVQIIAGSIIALMRKWVPLLVVGAVVASILFFIGFVLFDLLFAANPNTSKGAQILEVLNNNWKALLILVMIPFYSPIYNFLANLRRVTLPGGTTIERGEPPSQPPSPPPQSNGEHQ